MVPVPVTVKLVEVEVSHPLVPANVHVPEPTAMVLVFALLLTMADAAALNVTLNVAASNVPEVIVSTVLEFWLNVRASCNVTDPPGLLIINFCATVMPALVIV